MGYGRFEGIDTARSLARLFAAARLQFFPALKLKEKHREGAKVIKCYFAPATPYERALVHPSLNEAFKRRLREIYRTLDPVALLAQLRDAQNELGKRVDQRAGKPAMTIAPVQNDLAAFARELGDGWKRGEPVPRRPSMLDPYIPIIEEWLAAAPHLSAVDLLSRLAAHAPGRFGGHQRRTVQRLVKNWRSKAARQLISSTEITLSVQASCLNI
ncbi:hypothetical protein [Bradyrhizobium jicamae]|uniref:hypothetical protein n=1 Tax=Bradyrhizobium jicamae TaxID=280332 RepID=UPI001BA6BB4F|nr:hypothetical protein [Bradyrhizobium jicamae]MBR0938993.1 hypothetical protein [Bradyrhizobium jicamae]